MPNTTESSAPRPSHRAVAELACPATRFDSVVEWIMLILLGFMSLAFGAVHAWSELVVLSLTGLMVLCLLLKTIVHPRCGIVWTWTYVPAALLVVWGVVQAAPMPVEWVGRLAPGTSAAHAQLLGESPATGEMTLSLYPHATRHELRLLLAIVAVFFVTVNVYRTPSRIRRLLAAVVGLGGAVSLMALSQVLARTDLIYAFIPVGRDVADAGPFLVREHYGQFMCLCVGAALALLTINIRQAYGDRPVTLPDAMQLAGQKGLRRLWYLPAMMALGAVTVFTTLSHEAVVAALAAGAFTTMVIVARYSVKRSTFAMAAVTAAAVLSVLYVGFDALVQRAAATGQAGSGDVVQWTPYAVAGTGLGTLDTVSAMFGGARNRMLHSLVANDYVRTGGEIGLVGLAPAVMLGCVIWGCYLRGVRRNRIPVQLGAFGLGFGLFAVMVHSLTGSGLQAPAVACLTATFCGLLVNLNRMDRPLTLAPARPRRFARIVGVVVIAALWAQQLPAAGRAAAAEYHAESARSAAHRLQTRQAIETGEAVEQLISRAKRAVRLQPGNIEYRYCLALYQLKQLYGFDCSLDAAEMIATADPDIQCRVRRIIDDLRRSRELCPAYGPVRTLMGMLQRYVLGSPAGGDQIRLGARLAGQNGWAVFAAGRVDAEQRDFDASLRKFRRALTLDDRLYVAMVEVYCRHVGRADLALALAGEDHRRLTCLVALLDGQRRSPAMQVARKQALARLAGEKLLADVSGTEEPGDSGR